MITKMMLSFDHILQHMIDKSINYNNMKICYVL